jgi:PASTA domain-containing protein
MADFNVQPGDLITADLWNKMLNMIDAVEARLDALDARPIPDVVGDSLSGAKQELESARLSLATVIDTDGTALNPDDKASIGRIVITQMPSPGDFARAGQRVSLLVTGIRDKKQTEPDITSVTPDGDVAMVGRKLVLNGTNFTGAIQVSFGRTTLTADQVAVTPTAITIAKVPEFDGAPSQGQTKEVSVMVRNEVGRDSHIVPFTAVLVIATPSPVIGSFELTNKTAGVISGSNFPARGLDQRVKASLRAGNENLTVVLNTKTEMSLGLPASLTRSLSGISDLQLKALLAIDKTDAFLRAKVPFGRTSARGKLLLVPPATRVSESIIATLEAGGAFKISEAGNAMTIQLVSRARPPVVVQEFRVDVSQLDDVPLTLTVGNEASDPFVIKFGKLA